MIASLTGEVHQVVGEQVLLKAGAFCYELLVSAADAEELAGRVGQEVTLFTLFYIEGDSSGGNLQPRLIGFIRREDKQFFNLFTTVKGIGPKTALKALTIPVGVIAQAIESRDSRTLLQLKGIGKRTAELIIAELAGKVEKFAFTQVDRAEGIAVGGRRNQTEADAISTLVALGERRADAEHLLQRVLQSGENLSSTDMLVREMLRLRTLRGG